MIVYLLHFHSKMGIGQSDEERARRGLSPRLSTYSAHAGHYIGVTDALVSRLIRHRKGHGSAYMQKVNQSGITWHLARTWKGGFDLEKKLKSRHNSAKLCPVCRALRRRHEKKESA